GCSCGTFLTCRLWLALSGSSTMTRATQSPQPSVPIAPSSSPPAPPAPPDTLVLPLVDCEYGTSPTYSTPSVSLSLRRANASPRWPLVPMALPSSPPAPLPRAEAGRDCRTPPTPGHLSST